MADKQNDSPPDRLSLDPRSEFYDETLLSRGVGIKFNGQERTSVIEYSISEGWIRVAAGNVQALMRLIRSLRDDDRLTILLVEHNMELVMGVSDRVAVLQQGRLLAEGTPGEVGRNPAVVAAYLGIDD